MWREEGQDDRFLCDPRYMTHCWRKTRMKERARVDSYKFLFYFFLQEWSYSHGVLALQAGRKTKPTAGAGPGTSHPEGSHLQG